MIYFVLLPKFYHKKLTILDHQPQPIEQLVKEPIEIDRVTQMEWVIRDRER
jgi:hypothetical protein